MKNSHTNFNFFPKGLPRTDLACECMTCTPGARGTSSREYDTFGWHISELRVLDSRGEKATGKPRGRYVTVHGPLMRSLSEEEKSRLIGAVSSEISAFTEKLTKKPIGPDTKVLVAGLGNRFISADSIGPRTADKIAVTGHMEGTDSTELFRLIGCSKISAVHPGVMGQTGIEAAAMIKGAAQYAKPDVIIAVDALAARKTDRLCATVQLSDTGIEPGSGIGNRRCAVNRETTGFPVIALGVPTVVDCATLIFDALSKAGADTQSCELYYLFEKERSLFVSLRDSDIVSEEISSILAGAVNRAFFAEGL